MTEFEESCCPRAGQTCRDAFKQRALQERVRLQRKRQARLLQLQSKVQVSAAGFHRAKSALTEQRAKLKQQHEELQVLKRLRTTANASQCWTPAAVAKGFESFLAQAPIETDWRLEQVQQLIMDSNLHCQTLEKSLIKSKHDMDKARSNFNALQGK